MMKKCHPAGLIFGFMIVWIINIAYPTLVGAPQVPLFFVKTARQILRNDHVNGMVIVGTAGQIPVVITNRTVKAESAEDLTTNRYFPLASLTKLITGLAVYSLVNTGRLSLNTKLSAYFPKIPHASHITVRQLMTHTSGLIDTDTWTPRVETNLAGQFSFANHHFKSLGKYRWNYSNINYVLLAQIVGKVSGESYLRYVRQQVLHPWQLREIKPFTNLKQNQVTKAANSNLLDPWPSLEKQTGAIPGAGNYLATPQAYWQLLSCLVNDPPIMNWFSSNAPRSISHYFGGIYIGSDLFHASGSYPSYSIFIYSNYRSKKSLMLLTNNLENSAAKRVRNQLVDRYYH